MFESNLLRLKEVVLLFKELFGNYLSRYEVGYQKLNHALYEVTGIEHLPLIIAEGLVTFIAASIITLFFILTMVQTNKPEYDEKSEQYSIND